MPFLNQTDLNRLQALLDAGQAFEFYQELSDAGFNYPSLALGVFVGNSYAGQIATKYMIDVAAFNGIAMSSDQIEQVKSISLHTTPRNPCNILT